MKETCSQRQSCTGDADHTLKGGADPEPWAEVGGLLPSA